MNYKYPLADEKLRSLLMLCLATLLFSCMSQTPHYNYADGNANQYFVTAFSLQYVPVKPEESSTGMYSGGEPAEIQLTQKQFNDLRQLFEKAISATSSHITDRVKMSGQVTRTTTSDTVMIILQPNAPEQIALESALKGLLGK
ncbi:MAG: hypothetical protein KF845_06010 [Cyclobacteriaceae bacterium]|nr:hypothetical protein [Cyclobacteriaceae bacterium]